MVFGIFDKNIFRKFPSSSATDSSGRNPNFPTKKVSGRHENDGSEPDKQMEDSTTNHRGASSDGATSGFGNLGGLFYPKDEGEDLQEISAMKSQRLDSVFYPLLCMMLMSWLMGAMGVSWAWMVIAIGGTMVFVKGILDKVTEDFIRFESLRLHRRRALQSDETCEWLNLLINRWWVFSSGSIFSRIKSILDPRLQEAKPHFVETISLKQLTLGDRTPILRSVKAWDAMTSFRPSCSLHTPVGLALAPTHNLAILCDLVLDSNCFSAVLESRIGHKGMGVDLDVGLEQLSVEGRVVVSLFLDMEAPFPHIARMTFSFTERPRVAFRVRILKSVQMMEVPILKTWIHNLVTDALATAWVDPGMLELNIHSSEAFIPEHRPGDSFAQGVLTVTLKLYRGASGAGIGSEDDKWVVLGVEGNTHVSPPLKSHMWQYSCSFLLLTPLSTTCLTLKIKSKRLITTTLTQYDLPLNQYGFEHSGVSETVLQKKGAKVIGGSVPPLHVKMEYTSLAAINLEAPIPQHVDDIGNGAGVLYIFVHGADNLVPTELPPSPYCLVFNSRRKIKTTHYVTGSTNPRWDCGVEVLVPDVASACLTFVVCSLSRNQKLQDGDLLGIQTLNLSTIQLPILQFQLPLNRNMSSTVSGEELPISGSTLTVSIIFRCVPSVAAVQHFENPNFRGMPLPMPFTSGSPAGSPCLVSSSSQNVGSSASPLPSSTCSSRRGSMGHHDEEEQGTKKKINSHWLHQAKSLLGSSHDNDGVRCQDLEDILASGLGLIEFTINRARNLVARDLNGFSDPYCVVKVNGEVKYRTRIKKKTLDPYWNESFMTHLPKKNQSIILTLWDHDAFGMKDFLGSVCLQETQVRSVSLSNEAAWFALEGVKSGSLEVRIKVISEDSEFERSNLSPTFEAPKETPKTSLDDVDHNSSSAVSSLDSSESSREFEIKRSSEMASYKLSSKEEFKLSLPHRTPSWRFTNMHKASSNGIESPNMMRAFSNPVLNENNKVDSKKPLFTPPCSRKIGAEIIASAIAMAKSDSLETLTKSESNKILNTESKVYYPSKLESIESLSMSLTEEKDMKERSNKIVSRSSLSASNHSINGQFKASSISKTISNYEMETVCPIRNLVSKGDSSYKSKDKFIEDPSPSELPKISLNDQSEDEFGLSEASSTEDLRADTSKVKRSKSKEAKGLKAMRQKVHRGFGHPLRRYSSEANVQKERELLKPSLLESSSCSLLQTSLQEIPCLASFHQNPHLGVGGGEGDASDLLPNPVKKSDADLAHAWSQPNLANPVRNGRVWIPIVSALSTQVSSSSTMYINDEDPDSSFKLDINDLHPMERSEKSSSKQNPNSKMFSNVRGVLRRVQGLHVTKMGLQLFVRIRISEERSGGRTTTKTVGRSRLVPGSPSPIFECDWGAENELSNKAQIILEVRTSSRDLMCSSCVPVTEIFKDVLEETSGDVEKWINLDGGAGILLKAQFGGEAPAPTRRRSLFRSWSLHKIGKL